MTFIVLAITAAAIVIKSQCMPNFMRSYICNTFFVAIAKIIGKNKSWSIAVPVE